MKRWLAPVVLVLAAVAAFGPALRGGFIFDDNVFLTDNALIHARDGLARFWFSRGAPDYWPVTSSSFWLEWRLWHLWAPGYHATNVALHALGVLLLWKVLRALRVPGAWAAALLFAVHPLNAASVVWITERKNLLALIFCLLALLPFARVAPSTDLSRRAYGLSLLAFLAAMLSKGTAIVLPAVLAGFVVWRRRPTRQDLLRWAPFVAIALAAGLWEAQFSTVTAAVEPPLSAVARLLRGSRAAWFYAGKALWPAHLSLDYGHWTTDPGRLRSWIPLVASGVLTALLWVLRRHGWRGPLFAWGYFRVALLPALGLVSVGFMQYSPVSNHFVHLALPGMTALAGWLLTRFRGGAVLVAGVAAVLAVLAWRQAAIYADAETLYRTTLAENPSSWLAHNNLGNLLEAQGRWDEAAVHLETAVRLDPRQPRGFNNLGLVRYRQHRLLDALADYREAVRLDPDYAEAHNNLGATLARLGRLSEAREEFARALALDPDNADAQTNFRRLSALMPR